MVMRKILDRFRHTVKAERVIKVAPVIEDELFGRLTWDERYNSWRGALTLASGETATFRIDGVKTDESIPEAVRDISRFLVANETLIRDRVAVSMSEIYNGPWGGGDTITPGAMAQRITLTGVHFHEDDGSGELHYEAPDGLFTDHTICVPVDANGEIGEPELEG